MDEATIKLLHIDNDPDEMLYMRHILQDHGQGHFSVDYRADLRQAIGEIREQGYDAVLLDIGVNNEDGLRNIRTIKQQNPNVAVIALTRSHDEELILQAIDNGAQECLDRTVDDGKILQFAIRSSLKRKSLEKQLFRLANYDDLTGLANARLFQEHVEQSLIRAKRWNKHKAILLLTVDNLNVLEQELGHATCQAVLWETANRLTTCLRKADLVCRHHNHSFGVLLDDHLQENHFAGSTVARKLLKVINATPYIYTDQKIEVTASIGIAVFPGDSDDYNKLIDKAEDAMHQAYESGGNHFCFVDG